MFVCGQLKRRANGFDFIKNANISVVSDKCLNQVDKCRQDCADGEHLNHEVCIFPRLIAQE